MTEFKDDHRGHTIFPHASSPSQGPWVASYTAWKIEPNNSYRAAVQGTIPGVYQSIEIAHTAAVADATSRLDMLLDVPRGAT
jgi:hypothetical protein